MKKNLPKQEKIVSILWDFASDIQTKKHVTHNSKGIGMPRDACEKALSEILALFNIEVTEVQ